MHPTYIRYILVIFYERPSGIHLLDLNIKALRQSDFFVSTGTKSYIFEPRQDINSVPCPRELTFFLINEFLLQRSYGLILRTKSSFIIYGAILFLTLNISVAGTCTFL